MKTPKKVMIVIGLSILIVALIVTVTWRVASNTTSDRCYVPGNHAGAPAGCPQ